MRAALLTPTLLALVLLPAAAGARPALVSEAGAAAAVAAPGPVPLGKLGDAVTPSAYRLDLTVDPAQPRFSGKVEIDATVKAPGTRSFYLHGRGLAIHSAAAIVNGRSYPARWSQVDETGVARLDFSTPLPAGPVTLSFTYDAPFGSSPSGMHHIKVDERWYSWTQFESIDARAAFPSFDQPSFKTPFTVTLRTPPGLTAVSNAPEVHNANQGGLDVHRFAPTLPLPTYLVALMVGPFATVAGEVPPTPERAEPLPLRVVSPQPNAGRLTFALDNSARIVALLEGYFGTPFPFPKLDQITSPVEGGAMENAGADLYNDSLIVLDDNAPTSQKRAFGMVVAHELAHQWFGDLVTPMWWDDIWLNESFANWMGYRIGDAWRPDLNIRAGALREGFAAMSTDALLAGRPIRQSIETNSQIDAAFDSITYGKGGQVVAMIAGFMGDARFQQGVRRYLAAHRYGNATSSDFYAALADAAGDPRIVPAMKSFTDQQGVPLLTFSGAGPSYQVAQSRYVALGETAPEQSWGVPMCVRRGSESACRLLTEASADFTLAGSGPLVPNRDGTGYYRFELPAAQWDALVAGADRLDGGEAQAVADSLAASVRAGRSGAGALARLTQRLADHRDTYASDAAPSELSDMVDQGLIDDAGRAGWRHFLGQVYAPLLERYGLDPRKGAYVHEDPQTSLSRLQALYWVQESDRASLVNGKLADAAKAYLGGDTAALDPGFYRRAFAAYLDAGKLEAAKVLVDKALASEDPLFRPAAISTAARAGSPEIAVWLLDLPDARLRQNEKRDILTAVVLTRETREQGYAWLRAHFAALSSGANGIFFAARLPSMLRNFCSVERADEFARELRPKLKATPGELELERAIEEVRNCGRLQQARGAQISADLAALK